MGSLDRAISQANAKRTQRSKLEKIISQLDAEDSRKLVDIYLPNREYSAAQIARALTAMGYPISRASISDWREKHAPR